MQPQPLQQQQQQQQGPAGRTIEPPVQVGAAGMHATGAYQAGGKLAGYYPHSAVAAAAAPLVELGPTPAPSAGPMQQLSYLQQRHQQLALTKAMAHSTSMLAGDSYLAGMSSDSELSAGSSSSRAHARPHSSQSRVYHAHPAPRVGHPAPEARSSSTTTAPPNYAPSSELAAYGLGQSAPAPPASLGRRQHQHHQQQQQQQPPSPQHQQRVSRQLPSRPFKHSISVDQQSYHHHLQPAPPQHHYQAQAVQHQPSGGSPAHYGPTAGMEQAGAYAPSLNQQQELWLRQPQPQVMQDCSQSDSQQQQQDQNRFRHDLDYLEKRTQAINLASSSLNQHHSSPLATGSPTHPTTPQHQQQQHRHSALRYPAALGLSADQLPQSLHLQQANEQHQPHQGPVDWLPPMGRAGLQSAPFKQAMSIDQHQAAYPSGPTLLGPQPKRQQQHQQQANHYYTSRPLAAANLRQQDAELAMRLEQQKSLYLSQNNHYHHHGSHQQLYCSPTTSEMLPAGYLASTGQHHQSPDSQQPYTVQQQQQHRMQDSHYGSSNLKMAHGAQVRERSPGLQHHQSASGQHQHQQQLRSAIKRASGAPQPHGLGSSTSALNELGHTPELSSAASPLTSAKSLLVSSSASGETAPGKRPQLRAASPAPSLALGAGCALDSPVPGTSVAAREADRQQQQQQHYLAREQALAGQQPLASTESTRSESSTGLPASNGPHEPNNGSASLTKKSNSATQLSMSGTKKRLGFRKKQVTSFSVHRSEEVGAPADGGPRHLVKQGSSVSEGESSLSGDSSSRSWSNSNFKQQTSEEVASMSFIDGLGKGQMISRQGLASPYLGDIQLSLSDRRGNLEVEVIRARNLQAKANKILPLTYVKLYLVKNRKCLAKAKTALCNKRTLDPLFQQQLTFHEDYHGSILQSIVWGNFGKMDKKNFMGIAQISIDDLDLSDTVLSWYKLFLPSSLQTMPSKSLRHTLLSNSTESFTTNTNTNTNTNS